PFTETVEHQLRVGPPIARVQRSELIHEKARGLHFGHAHTGSPGYVEARRHERARSNLRGLRGLRDEPVEYRIRIEARHVVVVADTEHRRVAGIPIQGTSYVAHAPQVNVVNHVSSHTS